MCKNHEEKRTYGIELEGYTDENIRGNYVSGWRLTDDGSLEDEGSYCEDCDGDGNVNHYCYDCNGYGDRECDDCCGGGEVPCDECDCTGYVEGEDGEEVYCPKCEGSQYIECESCEGNGRIECRHCDGQGEWTETCEECGGSGGNGGNYGVECISSVLTEGEYEEIDTIFNYINRYDWTTNSDCGTHVHIGAKDLTATDLSKLVILGNIVEPMIYGTLDSERIDGTYAKKTIRSMVEYCIDKGEEITLQEIADLYYDYDVNLEGSFGKYDHARYQGINIHSWFYRNYMNGNPTVEFRYFEGCDDKELAKGWIDLCVKLVDFAKHTSFEQLMIIGKDFYNVDNAKEYIIGIKALLDLEYNFRPYSNYAFEEAKRNVASQFRNASGLSQAV